MKTKTIRSNKASRNAATGTAAPLRIKSILVPLDFSPPSNKALGHALSMAKQFKAKLTLLHVVEPTPTPDFADAIPLILEDDQQGARAKRELERMVKTCRVPARFVEKMLVRFGRSFHEIAEAARTRKADLIIISTHGYTGLTHALLGSTAERVVRHAPCPVLVLRQN